MQRNRNSGSKVISVGQMSGEALEISHSDMLKHDYDRDCVPAYLIALQIKRLTGNEHFQLFIGVIGDE